MKKHYPIFDWLRVGALALILVCHFLRQYNCVQADLPLGCVGNVVFFALSGWLLGLVWYGKGCPRYGVRFLLKRIVRLAIPLWLSMLVIVGYLKCMGYPVTHRNLFMGVTLMSWFDTSRLPGMTPYWFVTAIFLFYLLLLGWTNLPMRSGKWWCVGGGLILLQAILSLVHIRYGWFVCLLLLGLFLFEKGNIVLDSLERRMMVRMSYGWLGAFAFSMGIYYWGFRIELWAIGTPMCYWAAMIPSGLFVLAGFALFRNRISAVIRHLSGVSYEIFLMHSFVLVLTSPFGKAIMFRVILYLVLSYAFGLALNRLSAVVHGILNYRRADA